MLLLGGRLELGVLQGDLFAFVRTEDRPDVLGFIDTDRCGETVTKTTRKGVG